MKNPFYIISPPNFFKNILSDAIYVNNYTTFQDLYNIQIKWPIIKNIITVIYSGLGIEPIRYALTRVSDIVPMTNLTINILNSIGPKVMMVATLALSPFMLIPYLNIKEIAKSKNLLLLIYLSIWLFIWSSGFSFTRVILSCSIYLSIIGISQITYGVHNGLSMSIKHRVSHALYLYGLLMITLFTFWSLSTLSDLPVKSLMTNQNYDRSDLTRKYIQIKRDVLSSDQIIPNESFEQQWANKNNGENTVNILLDAPTQFRYFMNEGILATSTRFKNIEQNVTCYKIDQNQNLKKSLCVSKPSGI